jgi:hypothetical protein
MIFSAFLISHTYLALNIWTSRILSGPPPVIDESIVGSILGIAGVGAAITGGLTGLIIKKKDFPQLHTIVKFFHQKGVEH